MQQLNSEFSSIPKSVYWKEGSIVNPAVLYYEFQRIDIINRKRFLIENPNFYGINSIAIDEDKIQDNIIQINSIECIFSDGTLFFKQFNENSGLILDLNESQSKNSIESYVYIAIPESSTKNFTFDEKDSRFHTCNAESFNDWNNQDNSFLTLKENIFLCLDTTPPINCAYVPILKVKIENGSIYFLEYTPPFLTINSSDILTQMLHNLLDYTRKKLELLTDDINYIKNSENIINFIEKLQLNINLKHGISNLESLVHLKSATPELFYKECSHLLSIICMLNNTNNIHEISEYQHNDYKLLFDNLISKIKFQLDQEISDKYRTYKFNKKENMFFINFKQKLPDSLKIAIKKIEKTKDENYIEWLNSALICEISDVNLNREKRSLGFERNQEINSSDLNLEDKYLVFTVQTKCINNKNENIIVINQSNSELNKYEPEEILLYQEKIL